MSNSSLDFNLHNTNIMTPYMNTNNNNTNNEASTSSFDQTSGNVHPMTFNSCGAFQQQQQYQQTQMCQLAQSVSAGSSQSISSGSNGGGGDGGGQSPTANPINIKNLRDIKISGFTATSKMTISVTADPNNPNQEPQSIVIQEGEKVFILKTPLGCYLRTPDKRYMALRSRSLEDSIWHSSGNHQQQQQTQSQPQPQSSTSSQPTSQNDLLTSYSIPSSQTSTTVTLSNVNKAKKLK